MQNNDAQTSAPCETKSTTGNQLAALYSQGCEPPPRYGSKRDVAQMVQMSLRSVDNFLREGCPHLKLGKRRVRFDMAEVRAWLAENFHTQRRGAVQPKSTSPQG